MKRKLQIFLVSLSTVILLIILTFGKINHDKLIEKNNKKAEIYYDELEITKKEKAKKEKEYNIELIKESLPRIICWGDSLTSGSGLNDITYPKVLADSIKLETLNFGITGETTRSIAMRQGAIPLYVDSFTIPSDTTNVEISIKDSSGNIPNFIQNDSIGVNPCFIGSVKGTVSYDKNLRKYYFHRNESGEEKIVRSHTQIFTTAIVDRNSNDILIIFTGTADEPTINTINDIIRIQKSMIDYSHTDKYIVIGLTCKKSIPDIDKINETLKQEYGEHFLDIRSYILEHGLNDAGITPTYKDQLDIQNGEIPSSLRIDSVQGTSQFYEIIGKQLYNKILELNYLNNEQKEYLSINK